MSNTDIREEILNYSTEDYASVMQCIEEYKTGGLELKDLKEVLHEALDSHFEKRAMQLLGWMADNYVDCDIDYPDDGEKVRCFKFKGEWISAKELFENFL